MDDDGRPEGTLGDGGAGLPPIERPAVPTPPPRQGATAIPSPREVLGAALETMVAASGRLRPASLGIGLPLAALVGPAILMAGLLVAGIEDPLAVLFGSAEVENPPDGLLLFAFSLTTVIALLGVIALSIESQVLAASILGGQLSGRPLTTGEARRRARQAFWAWVRASIIIALPLTAIGGVLTGPLDAIFGPASEASLIVSTLVTTVAGTPFAFVMAGIVLGDVGAVEAIRRSVRLASLRWPLAVVIAVFAVGVPFFIQTFAFFAGLDIAIRVVDAVGIDPAAGPLAVAAAALVVAGLMVAYGTLLVVTAALAAAPQLVAFVRLTGFTAGLDRARSTTALADAPRTDPAGWLTRPMATGIVVSLLLAAFGILQALGRA